MSEQFQENFETCEHTNIDWTDTTYSADMIEEHGECRDCGAFIQETYSVIAMVARHREAEDKTEVVRTRDNLGYSKELNLWTKEKIEEKCSRCGEQFEQGDTMYQAWPEGLNRGKFCKQCASKKQVKQAI